MYKISKMSFYIINIVLLFGHIDIGTISYYCYDVTIRSCGSGIFTFSDLKMFAWVFSLRACVVDLCKHYELSFHWLSLVIVFSFLVDRDKEININMQLV